MINGVDEIRAILAELTELEHDDERAIQGVVDTAIEAGMVSPHFAAEDVASAERGGEEVFRNLVLAAVLGTHDPHAILEFLFMSGLYRGYSLGRYPQDTP